MLSWDIQFSVILLHSLCHVDSINKLEQFSLECCPNVSLDGHLDNWNDWSVHYVNLHAVKPLGMIYYMEEWKCTSLP